MDRGSLFLNIFVASFLICIVWLFAAADAEMSHSSCDNVVELTYVQFYTFDYCEDTGLVWDEQWVKPTDFEKRRIDEYLDSL